MPGVVFSRAPSKTFASEAPCLSKPVRGQAQLSLGQCALGKHAGNTLYLHMHRSLRHSTSASVGPWSAGTRGVSSSTCWCRPHSKAVTSGSCVRLTEGHLPKPNAGRRWVCLASSSADVITWSCCLSTNAFSDYEVSNVLFTIFIQSTMLRRGKNPLLPAFIAVAVTQLLGRAQLKA